MKTLKKILIGLVVVIALFLIVALFVKKEFSVEKEVVINKPKQEVFDYVKLVKNQEYYTVWTEDDPEVKRTYTGTDGTLGFIGAWKSNKNEGQQQITNIVDGERIDLKITFIKPFAGEDVAYSTFTAVSANQTKVVNGFKGEVMYPFNLVCAIVGMDAMMGTTIQRNLNNLKSILEKK